VCGNRHGRSPGRGAVERSIVGKPQRFARRLCRASEAVAFVPESVAAAKRGARGPANRWLDERSCALEALLAMKRAGADALHCAAAPRFAILT
jgi:hypothetical protein